jgi:hypothetical protein
MRCVFVFYVRDRLQEDTSRLRTARSRIKIRIPSMLPFIRNVAKKIQLKRSVGDTRHFITTTCEKVLLQSCQFLKKDLREARIDR